MATGGRPLMRRQHTREGEGANTALLVANFCGGGACHAIVARSEPGTRQRLKCAPAVASTPEDGPVLTPCPACCHRPPPRPGVCPRPTRPPLRRLLRRARLAGARPWPRFRLWRRDGPGGQPAAGGDRRRAGGWGGLQAPGGGGHHQASPRQARWCLRLAANNEGHQLAAPHGDPALYTTRCRGAARAMCSSSAPRTAPTCWMRRCCARAAWTSCCTLALPVSAARRGAGPQLRRRDEQRCPHAAVDSFRHQPRHVALPLRLVRPRQLRAAQRAGHLLAGWPWQIESGESRCLVRFWNVLSACPVSPSPCRPAAPV